MKDLILHPNRDFLSARNPSSPFRYKQQMEIMLWEKIYKESRWHPTDTHGYIRINGKRYFALSLNSLFQKVKPLFNL